MRGVGISGGGGISNMIVCVVTALDQYKSSINRLRRRGWLTEESCKGGWGMGMRFRMWVFCLRWGLALVLLDR